MSLWQNFENWMQLVTIHQTLQNQEFGWLWKRWGRHVFVESRTFKCEGQSNNICYYEQVFVNVFEGRESKCCALLMKHHRKFKGEQVITLQMPQELKTKNITVVPGQLFCCQCEAKFLLETDLLYWWSR